MLPLLPPTAASDVVRQAFTIGPPNVTHALSIVHDRGGTYTMSVLVPNVASQLKQDSPDDNRARACANTLRNGFVYNMLPAAVRQQLNLSQRRICGVFIVSTKVMVQQDGIVHVVSDPVITLGKVQSQVQLDYLEAQCLIDQVPTSDSLKLKLVEYPSFANQPDLQKSLLLLYKIAMHFRVNRLGQMGYAFEITQEVKNSWQAHLLVEELMMWANASVAEYVCKQMPKLAVLQKQVSPREEDVKGFLDKYGGVIEHSVALRNRKLQKSASKKLEPLLIPSSTLLQLHEAVQNEDAFYLQHLLTSDYLYPQLAAAKAHLKDIEEEAEYVCGQIDSSSKSGSTFCHYGQNLKLYTHFTSPTERFCDVVVQRILLSILNKTECTYNVEELENLCRHLNIRSREAKLFQREVKQVKLAEQFGESCEETNAYVYKDEHRFVVSFPDLRYQSFLKKAEFHISVLMCKEAQSGFLNWRVFMFSFQGNDFILNNSGLCFSIANSEKSCVEMTAFYGADLEKGSMDQETLCKHQIPSTIKEDAIAIDAAKWQNIMSGVGNPSEDTIQLLSRLLPKPHLSKRDGYTHSSTTVKRFKTSTVLKYEVKHKLGSNSVVPVWLGQTQLHEHIMTPCLQLIEVAPELRICLQHNTHPAECFSDPILSQASKAVYTSLDEYVTLWEKVYLAEVAHSSVRHREKDLKVLKDVPLQWPNFSIPENSGDGYFVPDDVVTLTIPHEKRIFFKYSILINTGDLVCVRYDVKEQQCKAVYHFVVVNAYEDHDDEDDEFVGDEHKKVKRPFVIEMKNVGKHSCLVSEKLKTALSRHPQPTCEMQVINVQESFNRVYKLLVSLKEETNYKQARANLAQLVARGKIGVINKLKNPSVANAMRMFLRDPMAHTLWTNDSELNKVQKEAITAALTNCFQLIQGPPGTGKSETGAHIAYIFAQLLKDHQCVVYCAPSNKAVDVVHEKLCEANKKLKKSGREELKLLRLYGKKHEKKDFPGPYTSDGYLTAPKGETKCVEKFWPYALHHIIRKKWPELTEMEKKFDEIHKEGQVPSPLMLMRYKKLIDEMEQTVIDQKYHIILGTCNECAGRRLTKLRGKKRVAQLIVDECGMAHEPETIAAVSLSEHVVLIGDHKQLQPVVRYFPARENGLGTSLFQRYAENFEGKLISLRVQYRMHTKICDFPSKLFYSNKLEPDRSVNDRDPVVALQNFWPAGLGCPIVFCDMVGEEGETPGLSEDEEDKKTEPSSKCNLEEAKKAVQITQVLQRRLQDKTVTIAIITPYKAQKDQISDKITKEMKANVTALTINESQGDEYDYVILTTVRSQPLSEISNPDLVQPDRKWLRDTLGFVTDPHKVNVAITRAKQGLIIVGNRILLEYDNVTWKPLIQFYQKNNCIVKSSEFPRRR